MSHPSKMPHAILSVLQSPLLHREHLENSAKKTLPLALLALSTVLTLVLALVGGLFRGHGASPKLGSILFHVYFSIVFYILAWVGTGTAARSFVRERAAGTWEALLLTEMTPEQIAKGKLTSAFIQTLSALLMLAPAGLIPWTLGGVSPTELILGYLGLFGFATLWVALGAAVGSRIAAPTFAMALSILVGAALAGIVHWGGGLLLSVLAYQAFPVITRGAPIWWPVAVAGSPANLVWAFWLFILPLSLALWLLSLLYQLILNGIRHPLDEHMLGMRRWFITTAILFCPLSTLLVRALNYPGYVPAAWLLGLLFALVFAWAIWLAGESPVPSARAWLGWQSEHESVATFHRKPGLLPSVGTSLVVATAALVVTTSMLAIVTTSETSAETGMDCIRVVLIGLWMTPFAGICLAAAGLLRLRTASPKRARLQVTAMGLGLWVVPWLLTALSSRLGFSHNTQSVLSALFPSYGFTLADALPTVPPLLIGGAVLGMLSVLFTLAAALVLFARRSAEREKAAPRPR
jgi:hypothetical protein